MTMMMARILLGFLYLSGWCISTCLLRQYHYVADPMTWTEAQKDCRKKYTDLATIGSPEEMNQLLSTLSSAGVSSDVWIGLYSKIVWKWSNGYRGDGAEYRKWDTSDNEPDFPVPDQYCVIIASDGRWWDDECTIKYPFVCNAGTELNPEFVFVNEEMTWLDAQKHCREQKFTDLATVRNSIENSKININGARWAWMGLFRDPNMYWSDGTAFSDPSVRKWASSTEPLGSKTVICGIAISSKKQLKLTGCEKRLPFVCYEAPPTPVTRQVVKLRVKSSADLNDPAVKADMLRKFQDKLNEKGVSGVTLKWREQPDGKVFHKERNRIKTEL